MPRLMKHNPAFLDDDALVAGFHVRRADLDLIVETLHENIDARANQHLLVIGPRGMGKTTLVRRVAIEARRDPVLSAAWHPIVFGEESYSISDAGEFWLEAILHLADDLDDPKWHALHETLLAEPDSEVLRVRALARLTEFADERGARLLLVVENLQMVLGEQLDAGAASNLRHTLQNEPRIMLLSTAANRFDAIEQPEQPMFDLFRVQELEPLTEEEARTLWDAVAERPLTGRRIRPVHILTGGNPRLLSIVAAFSQKRSFAELMTDLVHLVDDHTTYFKANVESLPPGERKVLVALADLWSRATSRQVAERSRLGPKKASAYLKRLSDRGVVKEVDRIGRVRLYELTERLYNIYHLMRRRGGEQAQVKALVEFMIAFYDTDELGDVVSSIASEACVLDVRARRHHLWALAELMDRGMGAKERRAWLKALPAELFQLPELPASLSAEDRDIEGGWDPVHLVLRTLGCIPPELRLVCDYCTKAASDAEHDVPRPTLDWLNDTLPDEQPVRLQRRLVRFLAFALLGEVGLIVQEARGCCADEPGDLRFQRLLLSCFVDLGGGEAAEACDLAQEILDRDPAFAPAWLALGAFHSDPRVARKAFQQAVDLAPRAGRAWAGLGWLSFVLGQPEQSVEALERAVHLSPFNASFQLALAWPCALTGQWPRAERALSAVLSASNYVQGHLDHVVSLLLSWVKIGRSDVVRAMVSESPCAELLAPVDVAIALHLEEAPNAPREVLAVARDLADRLDQRSIEVESGILVLSQVQSVMLFGEHPAYGG